MIFLIKGESYEVTNYNTYDGVYSSKQINPNHIILLFDTKQALAIDLEKTKFFVVLDDNKQEIKRRLCDGFEIDDEKLKLAITQLN